MKSIKAGKKFRIYDAITGRRLTDWVVGTPVSKDFVSGSLATRWNVEAKKKEEK